MDATTTANAAAAAPTAGGTARHSAPPSPPQPSGAPVPSLPHKIVSASVGALLTSLVTTPFEVVKTRLQTAVRMPPGPAGAPPPPLSAVATAAALVRREGLRALWSGLSPSLVMAVPSTAMYFTTYEGLKAAYEAAVMRSAGFDAAAGVGSATPPPAALYYAPLVAGIAGRSLTVAVVAPLELVRTTAMYAHAVEGDARAAAAGGAPPRPGVGAAFASWARSGGVLASLRGEVAAGGVASLWRGLSPTLWRDVPFSGIYWLGYERVKAGLLRAMETPGGAGPSWEHTFGATFAAGMAAGSVAAAVTTPFDVVKTRRQVRFVGAGPPPGAPVQPVAAPPGGGGAFGPPTSALLRQLLANEGVAGLFAGLGARVAKVAPSCAIMISSYEVGKQLLASRADEDAREGAGGGWERALAGGVPLPPRRAPPAAVPGRDADEAAVTPCEQ